MAQAAIIFTDYTEEELEEFYVKYPDATMEPTHVTVELDTPIAEDFHPDEDYNDLPTAHRHALHAMKLLFPNVNVEEPDEEEMEEDLEKYTIPKNRTLH